MNLQDIVAILILMFSAVVHEVMHGAVAEKLGDPTARNEGRLTLNPISHLDIFGSIILPAILIYSHSPVFFAYAKPVPVNFYAFRDRKWGTVMVSLAGPLSNFALAVIAALLLSVGLGNEFLTPILKTTILTNLSLCIFNLLPIPPLDGGKAFVSIFAYRYLDKLLRYEQYGFFLLVLLLYLGTLTPIIAIFQALFIYFFGLIQYF